MPPSCFTPSGSPSRRIGTWTWILAFMSISPKSTWIGSLVRGWNWISRISAWISESPTSSDSNSCSSPWRFRRALKSCWLIFSSVVPPPMRLIAAGTKPARRRRPAAAEPDSVRSSALMLIVSFDISYPLLARRASPVMPPVFPAPGGQPILRWGSLRQARFPPLAGLLRPSGRRSP